LLLFNPSVPNARVSPWLLVAVAGGIVAFFLVVIRAVMRARAMPRPGGIESLVGQVGVTEEPLAPEGTVRVRKESWSAESTGGPIPAGAAVRVVRTKGLRLFVEPAGEPAPGQRADEGGDEGTAAAARQGSGREGE
jgi:membrane-bound serine protease (ClpP class)